MLKQTMSLLRSLVILVSVFLPGVLHATDLKIATVAPEGSSWMKDLRVAGAQIKDRTSGRVNLKFYGGGIQGSDRKVLRKIRIGQLHGGVFTSNGLQDRYPDIVIYGSPMLFDTLDEVDFVRSRLDKRLAAGLEDAGFVSFGFAGGGFAYLMSNKPVTGIADLRGQKIWVPEGDPTSYAAMESLQLSPVALPITDVLTGLQTSLLDIVATPPVGAVVLQWYTKTKYITTQPLSYTIGLLAIDRNALKNVSAADQAVLREVMTKLYKHFDAQNRIDNAKAEQALRANGMQFLELDPAEVPVWRASTAGAMDKLAASGSISADLLREARGYVQEYRAALSVSKAAGPAR
ncbi:MAG: TRAP transporter substrate-binding protein DctP [Gammaproteobacteria bacterium]|nr:TRAP transporter substrate-binding protein DctP [Gammaproteobacteria bacterium]